MIAENRRVRAHTDWILIFLVMAVSIFGIYAVSIATYTPSDSGDMPLLNHILNSSYARRQGLFVLVAPLILSFLTNIPFLWFRKAARPLFYLSNLLLLVVWVFNRATGVKAWLDTLWGFTIQPSEFAKLSLILALALELSLTEKPMETFRSFIRIAGIIGIPAIIIVASGEMGSLLVMIFMFGIMLYFGGVNLRLLIGFGIAGVLAILLLYAYLTLSGSDSYRLVRILAFLNPEEYSSSGAYQQTQSMMTIGSGGATGIGVFVDGAMSQLNYVPADWTDFIFATIGEAFGFRGCMILLAAYFLILLRMIYLAIYTYDRFGMLIIIGVIAMLLFHVFENIGMCTGLMPITGIPLPFVSYGGSNMVTNMGGIGMVLNVTKHRSLSLNVATPQTAYGHKRFMRMPKGR